MPMRKADKKPGRAPAGKSKQVTKPVMKNRKRKMGKKVKTILKKEV